MEVGFLSRARQPRLRYALFSPEPADTGTRATTRHAGVGASPEPSGGRVLITPGFAEHIDRYDYAARLFAKQGFHVAVYDLRGQGHSEGPRGFVEHFEDYVDDALDLLDELDGNAEWPAHLPAILFGHSLGALISTYIAQRAQSRFSGLALSSPFYGLALPAPSYKKVLGRALSSIWPRFSQLTHISASELTHDAERARAIDNDPLAIKRVTARWFAETERAQKQLPETFSNLRLPVYCQAAGADRIASIETTRELFAAAARKDCELVVHENAFHELHQEVARDQYLTAFAERFDCWVHP